MTHIPDPTVKTNLPTNLLSAISNGRDQLAWEVRNLALLLDAVGWPEGIEPGSFLGHEGDPEPALNTALDHARDTVRLTWVLCGLVSTLADSLGVSMSDARINRLHAETFPEGSSADTELVHLLREAFPQD